VGSAFSSVLSMALGVSDLQAIKLIIIKSNKSLGMINFINMNFCKCKTYLVNLKMGKAIVKAKEYKI
jgi:hypothetical protein